MFQLIQMSRGLLLSAGKCIEMHMSNLSLFDVNKTTWSKEPENTLFTFP